MTPLIDLWTGKRSSTRSTRCRRWRCSTCSGGSLHAASPYPKAAQITTLPQLEAAARALGTGIGGPEAVREAHVLRAAA